MPMEDHKVRLIVVRRDGLTMESEFRGWHAESASDILFNQAKEDERTIFVTTIENGDGRRQFFADEERAK